MGTSIGQDGASTWLGGFSIGCVSGGVVLAWLVLFIEPLVASGTLNVPLPVHRVSGSRDPCWMRLYTVVGGLFLFMLLLTAAVVSGAIG